MKHSEIHWNPDLEEWFCVRCERTSDHTTKEDAETELAFFECSLPVPEPPADGQKLAQEISREKDPQKSAEVLALLRALMREDAEEIRVRMVFLAQNYSLIGESQDAD